MQEINVTQNELITGVLLNRAFGQWIKAQDKNARYGDIVRDFKALIHNHDFLMDTYSVTPEVAVMIRGMTGPHGYAYCKMLMAQSKLPWK